MERHARILLVIAFVALTTLALVLFYRWIERPDPETLDKRRTILFGGSVSGLSIGSDVRYLGVPVGRVAAISLSRDFPGHVDVDFTTNEALPPAERLLALLEPQGITGLSVVELRDRSEELPGFATPPGTIPGYPSVLAQVTDSAGRIASTLESTLARINESLGDEALGDLAATLRESRVLTQNLAAASGDVNQLIASTRQVSGELEQALPEIRAIARQLDAEVLPAVAGAGASIERAADDIDAAVTANSDSVERALSRDLPTLVGTTDELAATLQQLSALLASLDDEPGVLLYGKRVREVEIARD